MRYRIELVPEAEKSLARLAPKQRQRLARKIDLAENPRPQSSKKLMGPDPPLYRIASGDYRVLYSVRDDDAAVLIVRVGDRKSVYRRLPE